MRRQLITCCAVFVGFAVTVRADDKPTEPVKPKRSEYLKVTTVSGDVTYVGANQSSLKVRVSFATKEINQGEVRAVQRAQLDLRRAQARRDANAIARAQRSIAYHQARIYSVKNQTKEYTIQPVEDFEVRLPNPKPKVDDMGNFVPPSKAEIIKLRGKDKLFPAEWADLETGQKVVVQVVRPRKPDPKAKPLVDTVLSDKLVIVSGF